MKRLFQLLLGSMAVYLIVVLAVLIVDHRTKYGNRAIEEEQIFTMNGDSFRVDIGVAKIFGFTLFTYSTHCSSSGIEYWLNAGGRLLTSWLAISIGVMAFFLLVKRLTKSRIIFDNYFLTLLIIIVASFVLSEKMGFGLQRITSAWCI